MKGEGGGEGRRERREEAGSGQGAGLGQTPGLQVPDLLRTGLGFIQHRVRRRLGWAHGRSHNRSCVLCIKGVWGGIRGAGPPKILFGQTD